MEDHRVVALVGDDLDGFADLVTGVGEHRDVGVPEEEGLVIEVLGPASGLHERRVVEGHRGGVGVEAVALELLVGSQVDDRGDPELADHVVIPCGEVRQPICSEEVAPLDAPALEAEVAAEITEVH